MLRQTFLVVLLSTLQACGDNHTIDSVKLGVMEFDKSLSVGEAFDNWKECSEPRKWETFKSDNGRTIVQFSCKAANAPAYMDSIKKAIEGCETTCTHLDILEAENLFQWTINKDDTFKLSHSETNYKWKDGRHGTVSGNSNNLRDVFLNKDTFELQGNIDNLNALLLSNIIENLYFNAAPTKSNAPISNSESADKNTNEPNTITEPETKDKSLAVDEIIGSYILDVDGTQLKLNVEHPENEESIKASIIVVNDRCDGMAEGLAVFENNELIFSESDSEQNNCTVKVKFSGNQAISTEQGCDEFHGVSCSFSGEMTKN